MAGTDSDAEQTLENYENSAVHNAPSCSYTHLSYLLGP